MTDKWKDERRPARRPGGDTARSSKGVRKFSAPRKFAGPQGEGERPRAGYGKPRPGGAGKEEKRKDGMRGGGERPERPARRFADVGGPDARKPRAVEQRREPVAVTSGPERIAKVMARAGVASRRDAEVMIAEGRVSVNGKVIDTPATLVGPADRVLIDGAPMPARERTRLWLFHKPRGLVTTARDPEGRPTVFDSLPADLPRVVAVGRLDINTEGLLLLTNDGGLARVLAHPDTAWLRRYRVRAYGAVDQAQLDALRDGITIDGMHYGPVEAAIQRAQGDNVWLTLGLREGKNREVKRILEHLGLRVNRLIRVSFGPFQLGDLGEGALEEVRTRILKDQLGEALAREAGVDFETGLAQADELPARQPSARPLSARTDAVPAREGRFRSREDFLARGPRAAAAPAPAYKREAYEQRSKERAVWRDEETEAVRPKGTRVPRRGADARESRALSGEREHVRAGAITDPGGRTVKVERLVPMPKLAERSARKVRPDLPDEAREGGFRKRDGFDRRGPASADSQRPARRFGRDEQGDERRTFADRANRPAGRPDEGFRRDRDDRPRGDRPGFRPHGDRPQGDRPSGDRPRGKSFRDEGFGGDRPRGDRPGFRPHGDRPQGDRPSGDRPRGKSFRDGGFGGDRPRGDRPGFRPHGDRPQGDRPSGDRPRGKSFRDEGFRSERPSGEKRPERKFAGKSFEKKPFRGQAADDSQSRGRRDFGGRDRFAGKPPSGKSFGGKPSGSRPGGSRPPRKS
ncbi:23S rRNA pseudouridine2605 synthase [Pseudochelatococcus lubricantis]|uniref:Pseudouridine synthase n=1 Tax=Pseudochelatococcus lubricantis TaxID=1538102 RepID=A0ABX0UX31_9HYPH|nr:pseudouridine synthase [Pseudochelatococcus lubricantis]NIJ56439.1 23S rRNA pseudouridine2605 synthase [Pseudochelatococcus lubricantis]